MLQYIRQFIVGAKVSLELTIADLSPWILLGVDIPRALFQALFFILMAKAAGGDSQARFALIGNAIMVAVHTALVFMAGVIESEKVDRNPAVLDCIALQVAAHHAWKKCSRF